MAMLDMITGLDVAIVLRIVNSNSPRALLFFLSPNLVGCDVDIIRASITPQADYTPSTCPHEDVGKHSHIYPTDR